MDLTTDTHRDRLESIKQLFADLDPTRTVCGTCGIVVHEGPVSEGREAFAEHLADEHPEIENVYPSERERREAWRRAHGLRVAA